MRIRRVASLGEAAELAGEGKMHALRLNPPTRMRSALACAALLSIAACAQPARGPATAPGEGEAPSEELTAEVKGATRHTEEANARVLEELPFEDRQSFEDASRGFIAPLPDGGRVEAEDGTVIWDDSQYQFARGEDAPPTTNPSLWRQLQLTSMGGLYEVVPGIYQVRGLDLAHLTFVEGEAGVTVIDTAVSAEVAAAALALYREHRGDREVVAVIHTHSHVDHFGGVRGVVDEADVKSGKVRIVAPAEFMHEAISENVYVGNVMTRRASYMYGNLLPRGPRGTLGTGLGTTSSAGTVTLLEPTDSIEKTGETLVIDGLTYEFLMAPHTEAPAEMHIFIREKRALTAAENAVHNLHNLYTLRGAKVRDARRWPRALQETIDRWGDEAEVLFAPHHWPVWGKDRIVEHLELQRDLYKFIHDQTLRLANRGYSMVEVAEAIELPEALSRYFGNRGYYGTVNHNVKAVWNFYLGYFDGNPARLHPLPPAPAGERYVEYMGGPDAVVARARRDFERGEYRWVAQVLDHVVSADPERRDARLLLADALEQLGYQAESGPWRNFYLSAAQELRAGIRELTTPTTAGTPDVVSAMPLDMLFDYLAIHIDGTKAAGRSIAIDLALPGGEGVGLVLERSVLHALAPRGEGADATVTLDRETLNELLTGQLALEEARRAGRLRVEGDREKVAELLSLVDEPEFWFEIATPVRPPAK